MRSPRHFARGERGAAAVEFALVLGLLVYPVLNVVDLALYAFTAMQTQNAAQMGAQAAFSNCNTSQSLPTTTNCFGSTRSANSMTVYAAVSQAIQGTQLGSGVTLANLTEGYYCPTTNSTLSQVPSSSFGMAYPDMTADVANTSNTPPSMPSGVTTCSTVSSAASSSAAPGDFVQVTVTYPYTPIFGLASVASLLPSTISANAYARVD